jgi:hypothetical protein
LNLLIIRVASRRFGRVVYGEWCGLRSVCVSEKDKESQDDTGYHEGALEGEHRGSSAGGLWAEEQCRRW